MRRWLALGVAVVGVAWGPYLYTELAPRAAGSQPRRGSPLMAATTGVQSAPLQTVSGPAPATGERHAARGASALEATSAEQAATPTEPPAKPTAELGHAQGANAQGSLAPGTNVEPSHAPGVNVQGANAQDVNAPASNAPAPSAQALSAQPPNAAGASLRDVVPAAASDSAGPPHADGPAPAPAAARSAAERSTAFHGAFEAEPRDPSWAAEQESSLLQLMAAVGLSHDEIADITCRRTLCRVSFTAPQLAEAPQAALQARTRSDFGDALLETHETQSERGATLYVLRAGLALEALPHD